MKCPNIKELYGQQFKIRHDPAAALEPGGIKDPWLYVIPCLRGEIYPFDDKQLAVMVTTGNQIVKLKRLGLTLHQDADQEAVFLFEPNQFDQVAKIVKPRRRRRLSPERRKQKIELLRPFRFSKEAAHKTPIATPEAISAGQAPSDTSSQRSFKFGADKRDKP